MRTVGIIGVGLMGRGMALNFLQKGHEVWVWNRTKGKINELLKQGAKWGSSPKEIAEKAELVIEITANDQSSKKVWMGSRGILAGADKKKILISSATLSVGWTDQLIKACKKMGFNFMDMPLTGGRVGAETGNLTLLVGGEAKILKKISKDLQSISGKIFYMGEAGHGMRYKLILNMLQAVHIVGFGEAMKMAKKAKMNLNVVAEALVDRPGGVITQIASNAYFAEPKPTTFSIEWISKDLGYAKKMAKGLKTGFLDEALAVYQKVNKKYAKKDWARVNKLA